MKGFAPFLIGLIGMCCMLAITGLIPVVVRRGEEGFMLIASFGALVFLNVLIVGIYRILTGIYEAVVYPDDIYQLPQKGKPLFWVGYGGILGTPVLFSAFLFMTEITRRFPMRGRDMEFVAFLCWGVGCGFLACWLAGVLIMAREIFNRAFYRGGLEPRQRPLPPAWDEPPSRGLRNEASHRPPPPQRTFADDDF